MIDFPDYPQAQDEHGEALIQQLAAQLGADPNAAGSTAMAPAPDTLGASDYPLDETGATMSEQGFVYGDAEGATGLDDDLRRQALTALYGPDFPLARAAQGDEIEEQDWVSWAEGRWDAHRSGVERHLHRVERNRLFRGGTQWVTATGLGPWTEPPKPRDAARCVYNMVDKALDQRLQVVTEQRPGFRTKPTSQDPDSLKRAEAQQLAVEYQYDTQGMEQVLREAAYWAGTDGVSFLCSYWDPEAGPWYEVGAGVAAPMGDVRTCVYRVEQVRVSANASAHKKPWYWVIRETLPLQDAVARYGERVVQRHREARRHDGGLDMRSRMDRLGTDDPAIDELHSDQETIDRYTIYCERSQYLPRGLQVVVVGDALVYQGDLLPGVVPVVRLTDGSSDPAFYPRPIMEGWIDHQMRVNAIVSKWVESIRINSGGRLLAREGDITSETLVGGGVSVLGVKNVDRIQDAVMPLSGFSVGNDVKELFALEKKAFEDASGWNDTSRGQFTGDASGRAILAVREQLERVFAPPVAAAAKAMSDWAKIQLHWMRYGYQMPRMLAVMGAGRPDLAREVSSEDFDGASEVEIDPETLMPLPRAMRLYLLQEMLANGTMTPQEYRQRVPFAWVRSLATPDADQEARANRVCEAIRQSGDPNALPMLWQDNEAIHQDVLERQLILPDDPSQQAARQAAMVRWGMLAQQAAMKQGAMAPGPVPAPGGKPGGGKPPQMSPASQPLLGSNPGVATASARELTKSDQDQAAAGFEKTQPV